VLDCLQLGRIGHIGATKIDNYIPAVVSSIETQIKGDIDHVLGIDVTAVLEKWNGFKVAVMILRADAIDFENDRLRKWSCSVFG
jgi:hypothetical protein